MSDQVRKVIFSPLLGAPYGTNQTPQPEDPYKEMAGYMNAIIEGTWEDVVNAERGHIFVDRFDEGVRFLIKKGGGSLCAYVGVPAGHPLGGFDYDDIPLNCHGGLTFGGYGKNSFPEGYYWYGWDYAHSGDCCTYESRFEGTDLEIKGETKWDVKMVNSDSWTAIWDFRKLMQLAEKIRG